MGALEALFRRKSIIIEKFWLQQQIKKLQADTQLPGAKKDHQI